MFSFLIGLVVFIFDIIAVVDLIGRRGDTSKKVLWAVVIFFLPFLGMVCYFLLGRRGSDQLT